MPPQRFSKGACIIQLWVRAIMRYHPPWNPVHEGGHILRRGQLTKILPAFAVIFMLLLSACAQNSGSTTTTSASGSNNIPPGPIKIGVSLSLTGDDSADGKANQTGYETWAAYINGHGGLLGHQVQMVFYDDGTKQDQTRANYEKLITVDKVSFVVGPFNDPQTITGAEVARQHKMAFLEGIGTGPEVFTNGLTNLFAVSLSATSYFTSFVNYTLSLPTSLRPQTVAYATSDDGFTQSQIDSAKKLLEQGGLTTAYYHVYPAENAD